LLGRRATRRRRLRLPKDACREVEAFGVLLQSFQGALWEQLVYTSVVVGKKLGWLPADGCREEIQLVEANVLPAALDVGH
jgi:hypothetical protein